MKLLHHHQRRGVGLTFPFLLGALRNPVGMHFESEEEASAALVALLDQMRDSSTESDYVHIHTCNDLEQPVASVTKRYYHPNYAKWGISKPEKIDIDIDPPFGEGPSTDIAAAARLLWPVVALPVMDGRFSFSRSTKRHGPFDDADRQFIAEALAYDEENRL
jgi:hypothetical protein